MEEILDNPNVTVIDVRETFEFEDGHYEGAINIPLGTIPNNLDKIKSMNQPIVVYCRSGNRSGMALTLLKQAGIQEVYNGGGIMQMLQYASR
ncbi:rhodanese-like domain-containing protein [Sandaracinomonas limnophila]|uniref:Rhodanese-like domain-containing protein n=1 Tax=Sandaracinomonas limnophila TaxID=1862386 RepID=A0A437PXM3_9BACT|nr:rhodanese-like domain-containing protein [Sandaracinomonas limnophila]RVU27011.1 rhodanese-like domain-containing protein [Sandaracinomonas limnophila]